MSGKEPNRRILVAGGSGFIGQHLINYLGAQGQVILVLGRNKRKLNALFADLIACFAWQALDEPQQLGNVDVVINLAGENIASGLWTARRKKRLISSRLESTRRLVHAFKQFNCKPACFICASRVGVYPAESFTHDESFQFAQGLAVTFLGKLAESWERSAQAAEALGIRVVSLQQGAVLGKTGGVLKPLVSVYKFGLGARLGTGLHPFPWVSLIDVLRAIDFIISHTHLSGPVNTVAPELADQATFAQILASVLRRPLWLTLPTWLLKLVFGEMARELLLTGPKVVPKKLLASGFAFAYPDLKEAIEASLTHCDKKGGRHNMSL